MSDEWSGEERRQLFLSQEEKNRLWDCLTTLDKKLTEHLESDKIYKPKIIELVEILDQSKGVITFIRWSAIVVGAIVSIWLFVKDHLNFH